MDRIKILFLAANPTVQRLTLDEELRAINEKIRLAEYRDTFELVSAWAVRPDDLLQTLNQHRPHIVHFSGHGTSSGELILASDNSFSQRVSTDALKELFAVMKDNIQLLFLNACYSQAQAEALSEVIDCVVGMKGKVSDETSILFAASFYRALSFGRSIDAAFKQGKVALALAGLPKEDQPQLLVKPGLDASQIVLYPQPETQIPTSPRPVQPSRPASPEKGVHVFFSYAPEDKAQRDKLATHLTLMKRLGLITIWYDQMISGGTKIEQETLQQIEMAQIILLLISPYFFASDKIYEGELQQALERHKQGKVHVIPIILRTTEGWPETEFGKLQALPKDLRPVDAWRNSDEVFALIAGEIRGVVNEILLKNAPNG